MGHQTQSLPQLKLEPFDGDNAKWPDFAASFKARVHDGALSDCQRMAYLRSYLTHSVRSSIPQEFSDPSQYFEGLRSLEEMYGHPLLLAKVHLQAMNRLPMAKPRDLGSLERYTGQLNDLLSGLKKTGRQKKSEIHSLIFSGINHYQTAEMHPWRMGRLEMSVTFSLVYFKLIRYRTLI